MVYPPDAGFKLHPEPTVSGSYYAQMKTAKSIVVWEIFEVGGSLKASGIYPLANFYWYGAAGK